MQADWLIAWRLMRRLPRFLSRRLTAAEALAWTERAAEQRAQRLLRTLQAAVFPFPESPYSRLLSRAGITPGDLAAWLEEQGVDVTLVRLEAAGVYVTVDEFKGKVRLVRSGLRLEPVPEAFANRAFPGELPARSGASRSAGLRTVYDLENVAASWTVPSLVRLWALELLDAPLAVWYPPAPGAGPVLLLALAKGGIVPQAWFSPVPVSAAALGWRGLLGTYWVLAATRRAGLRLPAPIHAPARDPGPVAAWVQEQLRWRGRCGLYAPVSSALALAEEADRRGTSLRGATLMVSSESLTWVKRQAIERTGARVVPAYATMETGPIGLGCLNPEHGDEVHVVEGAVVCRLATRELGGTEGGVEMVRLTGLVESLPKILLNTETGDTARIFRRSCGCPLDRQGLGLHLHDIYGVDKLTGRGTTFLGTDIVAVLEQDLPARFGGSPLDYQLVEVEDGRGETRIVLRVAPRVGALNGEEVRRWFLQRIAERVPEYRLMAGLWRTSGAPVIERADPIPTARGKILPLVLGTRRARAEDARSESAKKRS